MFACLQEKLKAFQARLIEERKKRLEDRKRQRKEERRNTFYRQKEEEAQRIHEEQLKKGLWKRLAKTFHENISVAMETLGFSVDRCSQLFVSHVTLVTFYLQKREELCSTMDGLTVFPLFVTEREERERLEQEQREEEEREYQERLRKLEEQERKQRARQKEIEERERRREEERKGATEEKPRVGRPCGMDPFFSV